MNLPVLASANQPASLSVAIEPRPEAKVGSRRAGIACLPNGAMRVVDFASSGRELAARLADEFDRLGSSGPGMLTVRLRAMDVRLCARGWGLGNRRALSGRAAFLFGWSANDGSVREERIELVLDKDAAAEPDAIMAMALRELARRIASAPPA